MREEDDRRKNRSKNIYQRSGRKAVSPTGPLPQLFSFTPLPPTHIFHTLFHPEPLLQRPPSHRMHIALLISSHPTPPTPPPSLLPAHNTQINAHQHPSIPSTYHTTNTHQSSQLTTPPISNTYPQPIAHTPPPPQPILSIKQPPAQLSPPQPSKLASAKGNRMEFRGGPSREDVVGIK